MTGGASSNVLTKYKGFWLDIMYPNSMNLDKEHVQIRIRIRLIHLKSLILGRSEKNIRTIIHAANGKEKKLTQNGAER